jgi:hypothetical protein
MDFLEDLEEYNNVMHNAYLVITKKKTLDQLYKDLEEEGDYFSLPFNFSDRETTIENLIEHFSDMEDYEKCQELVNIKNVQKHK